MSSLKFNYLTKEMELEGSESFIESNFNEIQDLMTESFGLKRKMVLRVRKAKQESVLVDKVKESEADAQTRQGELAEGPKLSPPATPSIPEISQEIKTTRPPVRKYIRKVGIPGHERTSIQVVEQEPNVISLASLKEKFGLPESKIEGIIRDAEKQGKIRKTVNGSYVWSQD